MPKSVSTRSAYKMLTCIYLCRTLLFFAPYADFLRKKISFHKLKPIFTKNVSRIQVYISLKEKREQNVFQHSLPLLLYCSKSIDYFLSQHSFFSAQSAFLSQAVAQESLAWQQESDSTTASTVSTVVSSPSEAALVVLLPAQDIIAKENVTATAAKNNLVFIPFKFALNV